MSTLTRAQVLAEAAADRALRRGHGESNAYHFAEGREPASSLTRAEVLAEASNARNSQRIGDANRGDFNLRSN